MTWECITIIHELLQTDIMLS